MGRWADWKAPSYLPSESILMMGADPCHTPAREAQHRSDCTVCGGAHDAPNGKTIANESLAGRPDPVRDYAVAVTGRGRVSTDGAVAVCAGCRRSHWDGTAALDRAGRRDDSIPDTDRGDASHRTDAAVASPEREPDRPLTRRERRALEHGRKAP